MKKAGLWRRIVTWYRLNTHNHHFQSLSNQMDAKLLGSIGQTIRARDLAHYTPHMGTKIQLTVWHANAEALLEFITIVQHAVLNSDDISIEAVGKKTERVKLSLDDWLVDNDNYEIDLAKFWREMTAGCNIIFQHMNILQMDNQPKHSYYNRRMARLFQDTKQLMEALERVVLLDYE